MAGDERNDGERNLVVEFLSDADAACPVCGYQLRGIGADRCSECGSAIHLEVAGPSLGSFWWLGSLIGCGVAAAITALTLVDLLGRVGDALNHPNRAALVQAGVMSTSDLPRWPAIVAVTAVLVALSTLIAWHLACRRRMARAPRAAQITNGVAGALAPLLVLGLLRLIMTWGV